MLARTAAQALQKIPESRASGQLVPQEALQPPAGGVAPNHYSPTMARQLDEKGLHPA